MRELSPPKMEPVRLSEPRAQPQKAGELTQTSHSIGEIVLHLPLHLKSTKKKATGFSGGFLLCAPSMGALLRVQVPSQVDHDERSEAQLHEGDRVWEGSVEHKL